MSSIQPPPELMSTRQHKQQSEQEKKGYPGVSTDGIFQYNQPLTWFNTTTHDLVGQFLNTAGLDMFFPPSFEYELVAYIFNCADYSISHAYSNVSNFNTARLIHLIESNQKKLDELFVDRLNHVTAKWEEARVVWITSLAKMRDTINSDKNLDEEIRLCCAESNMAFGELTIRLVVAALYMTFVARLHLTNFVHDNHFLLKLQDIFDCDGEKETWYDIIVQQLFDQQFARTLLQIGGKLKTDDFVAEYLASDDEKKRAELINKHGALTHEDYYLGDFLMDLVLFVWKQYQTCFVDDEVIDDEKNSTSSLHKLVRYSRAVADNTPESVTNEKNIISFLNQINKKK